MQLVLGLDVPHPPLRFECRFLRSNITLVLERNGVNMRWAACSLVVACFSLMGTLPSNADNVAPAPAIAPIVPSEDMPISGESPWMEGWAGFGFANNFYGGWLGANFALNKSRNVWADGFLVRGEAILGHYDYSTNNVPGGTANVTLADGGLLLGYRKVVGSTMLTGYVGGNFENHDNPDPLASVRGTEVGVKVLGEIYSKLTPVQDFYGQASFSTAFDTWYILARPGFLVSSLSGSEIWVGPEGHLFGNGEGAVSGSCTNSGSLSSCRYEEGRIGAFLHIVTPNRPWLGDWIFSAGYRSPLLQGGGPDGYYAQLSLYFHP